MTFRAPLGLTQCRNITVTAHLAHGVVLPMMWPIPLDGALEACARRDTLGEHYGDGRELSAEQNAWLSTAEGDAARTTGRRPGWLAAADRQVRRKPLPLAIFGWRRPQFGKQWIWLASCALLPADAPMDTRWWHRRFGHARAEQVVGERLPATVYETHGPYRSYRVPLAVTMVDRLTWRVVGDLDPLLALCLRIDQLGRKRSQGEGVVLGWDAVDEGPADLDWALWTPDGCIARPVPARAAGHLGVPGARTVPGTIRAPYWRPPQTETPGGGFRRAWRDVLAPDTRRPKVPAA